MVGDFRSELTEEKPVIEAAAAPVKAPQGVHGTCRARELEFEGPVCGGVEGMELKLHRDEE
jgi:hypothetical protein